MHDQISGDQPVRTRSSMRISILDIEYHDEYHYSTPRGGAADELSEANQESRPCRLAAAVKHGWRDSVMRSFAPFHWGGSTEFTEEQWGLICRNVALDRSFVLAPALSLTR
jgi:hypothetical protein